MSESIFDYSYGGDPKTALLGVCFILAIMFVLAYFYRKL